MIAIVISAVLLADELVDRESGDRQSDWPKHNTSEHFRQWFS
jgi:hypothetical protein